jgi:hypothetical protein
VSVTGGGGKEKTRKLKVSVGYKDSWIGEGQISYGGAGAIERGELAIQILRERINNMGIPILESDFSLIGMNSLYRDQQHHGSPKEVRVRVAVRVQNQEDAKKIGNEVEALYTNGPAGGGGVTKYVNEVIAIKSVLIDEDLVSTKIHYQRI